MARMPALVSALAIAPASYADSPPAPIILTPPTIQATDENFGSIFSGKLEMSVPALKGNGLAFTPYSYNGPHFAQGGLYDDNYGHITVCSTLSNQAVFGKTDCMSPLPGVAAVQAVLGRERATYSYNASTGAYSPNAQDGSSFVDTGDGYCTWTKKDGVKVLFNARHDSSTPICMSDTVAKVVSPSGNILTYYYYGLGTTSPAIYTPIVSITSNSGYFLKYNYSGTPAFGSETSVSLINRAFEACDPAATSCTLTRSWPTATIAWQDVSAPDDNNFFTSYDPHHYKLTIQDQTGGQHIFELDNAYRIISYQPPQASSPMITYTHCTVLRPVDANGAHTTTCDGGVTTGKWNPTALTYFDRDLPQYFFDDLGTAKKNGKTWTYSHSVQFSCQTPPVACSVWSHGVTNPLGRTRGASGNSTPGLEHEKGPTESVSNYDGSTVLFEHSVANPPISFTRASGSYVTYTYDDNLGSGHIPRHNIIQTEDHPTPGSGTTGTIIKVAHYPDACSSMAACNKPDYVLDARSNRTDYSYDPAHGGLLSATDPAVYSAPAGGNVNPQKRYTYVQRYAWYLNSAGSMVRETTPVWLLSSESYCRSGPASGSGCFLANDEVLTAYDYGPDTGPNNLLVRGQTVTTGGQTQRVCYGHDAVGNKIWEVSPNANAASCPTY